VKLLPLLSALLLLAGCGNGSAYRTTASSKETSERRPVALDIAQLEQNYTGAKRAYSASKTDPNKTAYADATVTFATAVMAGEGKPNEKYPKALRLYNEALTVDPTNDEAKTNRQLILDIYNSLGKSPGK
jgi:hypothetical protein